MPRRRLEAAGYEVEKCRLADAVGTHDCKAALQVQPKVQVVEQCGAVLVPLQGGGRESTEGGGGKQAGWGEVQPKLQVVEECGDSSGTCTGAFEKNGGGEAGWGTSRL
eukprot:163963-Chlamydomonas_euryale.AAC.1